MDNYDQFGIFLVLTCLGLIAIGVIRALQIGMSFGRMLQVGTQRFAINRDRCLPQKQALVLRRYAAVCTGFGSFGSLLTLFHSSPCLSIALAGAVTLIVYGVLRLVRKYKGTENTRSLCFFLGCAICAGLLSLMYARPLIGAVVIGFVVGYTNYYFQL